MTTVYIGKRKNLILWLVSVYLARAREWGTGNLYLYTRYLYARCWA